MVRAIAVQAKWNASDYSSYESFRRKTRSLMSLAAEYMSTGDVNLVVLPEHYGTPLILAASGVRLSGSEDFESAVKSAVSQRLLRLLWRRVTSGVSFVRGLFLDCARDMALEYLGLMTEMARAYRSYLIPGSILLPDTVSEKTLDPLGSDVYNTAIVISPEGYVVGRQRKVHLIDLECKTGLDATPGKLEWIRSTDTGAGKLGVAICLDAYKDDVVGKLVDQGARIILQPSANPEKWAEALEHGWEKGSLGMVQRYGSLLYGINPMMVGEMFGLMFEGMSSITCKADKTADRSGYLARAKSTDKEEVVWADIDTA
jgi:predicted amidohydrolase